MSEINFEVLKSQAATAKAQKEDAEAQLIEKRKTLDDKIKIITDQFNAANAELIETVTEKRHDYEIADNTLRTAAIAQFNETGEKQIGFGISVRVNTAYEYDEQKAVDYAISHNMPHLLKVDGTKFKKFASITPIDFVTATPSPSAAISYSKD